MSTRHPTRLPGAWRAAALLSTGAMALWASAGIFGLGVGLPTDQGATARIALAVAVVVPMSTAAVLAWRRSDRVPHAVLVAGVLLVGWAIADLLVAGAVHWPQPVCAACGLGLLPLALFGMPGAGSLDRGV